MHCDNIPQIGNAGYQNSGCQSSQGHHSQHLLRSTGLIYGSHRDYRVLQNFQLDVIHHLVGQAFVMINNCLGSQEGHAGI